MSKHRSHLQILVDILSLINEGAKRTHIMYGANLSFKLLNKYLDEVLNAGLARLRDDGLYVITEKGLIFLDKWDRFLEHNAHTRNQLESVEDKRRELEGLLCSE